MNIQKEIIRHNFSPSRRMKDMTIVKEETQKTKCVKENKLRFIQHSTH